MNRFQDRREAGRKLGERLGASRLDKPLVVALPRGGVPVAFEVAHALHAPLDVVVARKIGAPDNPEYGIGAVSEDRVTIFHEDAVAEVGISRADLDRHVALQAKEVEARAQRFRGGRPAADVKGRTVVLVDDGLATGVTATAAARLLRKRGAKRVVLAVPVCAPDTAKEMAAREVDEVVCLLAPPTMWAIGAWYNDFTQVEDEEVIRLLDEAHARGSAAEGADERGVVIPIGGVRLEGDLTLPAAARAVVLFAHGSGSSRKSPRNRQVARTLNAGGLGTLLFDLLTPDEAEDREKVFDIDLLAERLAAATAWLSRETKGLQIGYFGASTGAAAALEAAAKLGDGIAAVVSRGGRPDLAMRSLGAVTAPTLLIVGEDDEPVLTWNREAQKKLRCENHLVVVPGATHLFEEPGALEAVARAATAWFKRHLERAATAKA
jgi:predicted phosphoribosyltransferase/dienelactone hydrolase